jgi:regulator of protease activity HflC (stomatin/prohibitin superfamily)
MSKYGIQVDKVFWLGAPRLPTAVTNAINAKIQSTQMAEQRKNEVAQATAEGQKEVALAQARATATVATAQAEAQAITLKNNALKDNPALIELTKAQRWNGQLPTTVMGQNVTPFLTQSVK